MKATTLFLAAGLILATAFQPKKVADKTFLQRQKDILNLYENIYQENPNEAQRQIAHTYNPLEHASSYKHPEVVEDVLDQCHNHTLLPRHKNFNLLLSFQLHQTIQIFEMLYYAKDYDTFYKTACWCREHVNPGQFAYAFSVAIFNRPDTQGLIVPPMYDVLPHAFVNVQVAQELQHAKEQGVKEKVVLANYTGRYPNFEAYYNPEQLHTSHYNYYPDHHYYTKATPAYYEHINEDSRISYYTEDFGYNAFNVYWHLQHPFWFDSKEYGHENYHHNVGERFLYRMKQILARYNLERLANHLQPARPIYYNYPLSPGYHPNLEHANGQEYPGRPDNMDLQNLWIHNNNAKNNHLQTLLAMERRIRDAIDSEYVLGDDGHKIQLTPENGADVLGKMIQGHCDSPAHKYYANKYGYYGYYDLARKILGSIVDPDHKYRAAPGVIEHYSTMLRDPLYYQLLARIVALYQTFKNKYHPYKQDQIFCNEFKVESVDVDKLITYFHEEDMHVGNLLTYAPGDSHEHYTYRVRHLCLHSKPFSYRIKVNSEKEAEAVVRVFVGPKYNAHGQPLSLQQAKDYFVELDRFRHTLKNGENVIERNSKQAPVSAEDTPNASTLYQHVVKAEQGAEQFHYSENPIYYTGYPQRLMLPKGSKNGVTVSLFVIVSPHQPHTGDQPSDDPHYAYNEVNDNRAEGYPFDRRVYEPDFQQAPNTYFKDVNIFHKRHNEV